MAEKDILTGAEVAKSKRITVSEIAQQMRLCIPTLYRMLQEGQIPHIRAGRQYIVARAAFERWLETCGTGREADRTP